MIWVNMLNLFSRPLIVASSWSSLYESLGGYCYFILAGAVIGGDLFHIRLNANSGNNNMETLHIYFLTKEDSFKKYTNRLRHSLVWADTGIYLQEFTILIYQEIKIKVVFSWTSCNSIYF